MMPFTRRIWLYGLCLCFAAPFILGALPVAAEERGASASGSAAYDIPSQDLAKALNAYAAASGVQVLYEAPLTAGRRSAAVKGEFSSVTALQLLLAGTGLVGRRTDVDAITITPIQGEQADRSSPKILPDPRFLGALQAGIIDALCDSAETRPGAYRMAIQLWITSENNIERAVLLDSTGDPNRDAALTRILRGVNIGTPPPAGMAQPVTLTIVPRSPLAGDECAGR
jgi:hypothetical protein